MKKFLIFFSILVLSLFFISNVFAEEEISEEVSDEVNNTDEVSAEQQAINKAQERMKNVDQEATNAGEAVRNSPETVQAAEQAAEQAREEVLNNMDRNTPAQEEQAKKAADNAAQEAKEQAIEDAVQQAEEQTRRDAQNELEQAYRDERNERCKKDGRNCIDSPNFTISTTTMFGGGGANGMKKDTAEQTLNNLIGTLIQRLIIGLGIIAGLIMTIGAGYMIVYHGQDELLTRGKNIFMMGIVSLVVALISYQFVALVRYIIYQ